MKHLNLQQLKRYCEGRLTPGKAIDACRELGGLGRWWLRPKVWAVAREYGGPALEELTRPELPSLSHKLGACWIVCRARHNSPLVGLRQAMLLPLEWRQAEAGAPGAESTHSPLLPSKLHNLANQVLAQARAIKLFAPEKLFEKPWRLHPATRLGLDFALADDLFDTFDSGWASLLSGLIAAGQGLEPSPEVWASVAWEPRGGLADVVGLPEKLALAVEHGANAFAVSLRQLGEAEEWVASHAPTRLEILSLPSLPEPWPSIQRYVSRFTRTPPPPNYAEDAVGFERCRHYHLNQPAFSNQDQSFYRSHLQPAIASRCRERVRKAYPDFAASHFVTIVSRSPDLAVILAAASGATHCLLLHTPDLADAARRCRDQLGASVAATPREFSSGSTMGGDIRRAVEAFTEHVPPERVVLDLKSATSKMKYWMARAARSGNWLLNLEAKMLDDRRNDPGSESPELWRA